MGRSLIVPAGPSRRMIDLRAEAPGWGRDRDYFYRLKFRFLLERSLDAMY